MRKEYCDVTIQPLENNFVVHYQKDGEMATTSKKEVVKAILKSNSTNKLVKDLARWYPKNKK